MRVSERDHDGKRETLGDGYDDNGDTDNEVVYPDLEALCEVRIRVLTTKQVNVALQNTIEEVPEEKNMDGEKGGVGSNLSDFCADNLKFLLKRSVFLILCELLQDLSISGKVTDHDNDHLAFTTSHCCTRKNQG